MKKLTLVLLAVLLTKGCASTGVSSKQYELARQQASQSVEEVSVVNKQEINHLSNEELAQNATEMTYELFTKIANEAPKNSKFKSNSDYKKELMEHYSLYGDVFKVSFQLEEKDYSRFYGAFNTRTKYFKEDIALHESYEATNGFGAKFTVTRRTVDQDYVSFSNGEAIRIVNDEASGAVGKIMDVYFQLTPYTVDDKTICGTYVSEARFDWPYLTTANTCSMHGQIIFGVVDGKIYPAFADNEIYSIDG